MKGRFYFSTNSFIIFSFAFFVFFVGNVFSQTPEQIQYYSERIELGTEDVKRDALFQLRNFETETASRAAIHALKDSSEIIRATATHSVIFLPKPEAVQVLLPLLNEKSEFVRRETVYALGKVGSSEAIPHLIKILQTDKILEIRSAAAISLGQIGDASAVESLTIILTKKINSKEEFLRRSSSRAIGNIARQINRENKPIVTPESFLPEKFKELKKPKYRRLVETFPVFEKANQQLIKILQNPKETDDVRREAAFALGEIGDFSSIEILKSNLNAEDYYLAEICEEALRKVYQNVNYANTDGID